ncbi:MAG: rRNA pseudouridine synthase [Treponema sp.]|nr:rRNA pseudouridine synthase [Candidatus Treponema equifaecale]
MLMKKRGSYLPANSTNSEEIRLQAFLAHCGVASRRASEKIILDGRVTVNGNVVTELGTKVGPKDKVCVDGNEIHLEEQKRYVLLNKPTGYVCTQSDEKGRPVAVELLKEKYSERLYNVGRLDMFSHGAIIFTNDGDFAAKLSHPSAEIEKEYIVESSLPLPRFLAEDFKRGIRVEGVFYKAKDAAELNAHRMKVILVEGKNREIRRVFESKNAAIRSLQRVRIGTIELGDLKPGESRDLSPAEVKSLLNLCKNR